MFLRILAILAVVGQLSLGNYFLILFLPIFLWRFITLMLKLQHSPFQFDTQGLEITMSYGSLR